jgi:PHD/YefM family antitoxin component YafN of YafNO toxin-antitoxin module
MASQAEDIQYITSAEGKRVGVIVPIALWQEIESERETAYLLRSEAMKQRLREAKDRQGGLSFEEARAKLGI